MFAYWIGEHQQGSMISDVYESRRYALRKAAIAIATWDMRLKIYMLPNFNMLFQLVLTNFFKSELFSCLPKVDHVIN